MKTKTKTKTNTQGIPNQHQFNINPLKYKQAIDDYMYEEDKKYKIQIKKYKRFKRFHMWYMLCFGSFVVGWETYQVGNIILDYKGWISILLISAYLLIIALWGYLIHNAFVTKQKMKEERTEEILNELTREK